MKFKTVLNFDDIHQKRKFLVQMGAASGSHQIEVKPYKPRRSNRANAFYWAAVVSSFVDYNEAQGVMMTPEYAHASIVKHTLGVVPIVNQRTGEVVDEMPKPTHDLPTDEFSAFVEMAMAWLAEFGIEIPSHEFA